MPQNVKSDTLLALDKRVNWQSQYINKDEGHWRYKFNILKKHIQRTQHEIKLILNQSYKDNETHSSKWKSKIWSNLNTELYKRSLAFPQESSLHVYEYLLHLSQVQQSITSILTTQIIQQIAWEHQLQIQYPAWAKNIFLCNHHDPLYLHTDPWTVSGIVFGLWNSCN